MVPQVKSQIQSAFDSFMDLNARTSDEEYENPDVKKEMFMRLKRFIDACKMVNEDWTKILICKMDEYRIKDIKKNHFRRNFKLVG